MNIERPRRCWEPVKSCFQLRETTVFHMKKEISWLQRTLSVGNPPENLRHSLEI